MKNFYLLLLPLLPLFSFSQSFNQKKVDSLITVLHSKKEDTAKVNTFQLIFEEYAQFRIEPKKCIHYNNQIYKLSKKTKYNQGLGYYYFNHIFLIDRNDFEKAIYYANKASLLFKKEGNIKYFLSSKCFVISRSHFSGKHEYVENQIIQTLPFAIKNNRNFEAGFLYMMLGRVNYDNRLLNASLKNYKQALIYYNKDNINPENKFELYFNISMIYTDLKRYDKALYYLNIINRNHLSPSFNIEIATNYFKMNDFKTALSYLIKNKKIQKTTNEDYANQSLIAQCYYKLKNYDLAIKQANLIINNKTNSVIKLELYNTLANSYLRTKDFKKAKYYSDKALPYLEKVKYEDRKLDFYKCRIEIAEACGNFREAYLIQKQYSTLNEAFFNKLNKEKVNELQIDFDVAEKDNYIKTLKVAELKKTIEINKQKNYITYGTIFITLILIGVLVFAKLYNTIKNKNTLININNIELQNTKTQLENSLHIKETLLKEIHHRVKNNLQLVMSILYIQSKQKDTNILDFLETSQSRITAMALIHENLYQNEDLSKVDFKEYAISLIKSIVTSYHNAQQDITLDIDVESIFLDIQTAIPLGLIINELVSNAFKHAFINNKKGIITMQLKQTENYFELYVKDNGIGMKDKVIQKKSLGLELVRQLVNQINGILHIHDSLGLQFHIQFKNMFFYET